MKREWLINAGAVLAFFVFVFGFGFADAIQDAFRDKPEPETIGIDVVVTDEATGHPIAGALVSARSTKNEVRTDTDGRARIHIPTPHGMLDLLVDAEGYRGVLTALHPDVWQGWRKSAQRFPLPVTLTSNAAAAD